MSIKSDRWIRRMALEQGMIDPFESGQVKEVNGNRVVSYGTSSYGYDVRCSNEFKLFTDINSTIVDPKNFDPRSFVDVSGDSCIIPPNSFALARTVESFRIPRNVLTICLGKCLTGDTLVVDAASGERLPLEQMGFGRRTFGLAGGRIAAAGVSALLAQGRRPVFELETRAGLRIRATANHPFRQPSGWAALEDLRPGDRIAAARRIPSPGRDALPGAAGLGREWARAGAGAGLPAAVFRAAPGDLRAFLRAYLLAAAMEQAAGFMLAAGDRERAEGLHHLFLRLGCFTRLLPLAGDWALQPAEPCDAQALLDGLDLPAGTAATAWLLGEAARAAVRWQVVGGTSVSAQAPAGDLYWDQVARITPAGAAEVYDISVPRLRNFLAADLVVHNSTYARCGIIVNVTPLEPEWEGHVTLEFSNTTPLPARIYANEGVAQMIFLEADADDICEVSYSDRGGKYQGQRGVTLPKT